MNVRRKHCRFEQKLRSGGIICRMEMERGLSGRDQAAEEKGADAAEDRLFGITVLSDPKVTGRL